MDVIRIHRLELDCIVGTRPQEREREQRVRLDLRMHADLSRAGREGRIALTTEYDRVADEIVALLSFRHYQLIEMAAEEASAMLLGLNPRVARVDLRIEKPGALEGKARAASVEVHRTREDFPVSVHRRQYGQVEWLLETREALLEVANIEPGRSIVDGPGFPALGLYWLSSGSLLAGNQRLTPGLIQSSSDLPSPLSNPGPEPARLFRCWKRLPTSH